MPYRPKTPCKHPGCGMLVEYGQKYCAEHKPLHPEYTRQQASEVTAPHGRRQARRTSESIRFVLSA